MAHEIMTARAQAVTPEDFNKRVKRLLDDNSDPRRAGPKTRNFNASKLLPRA